MGLPESMKNKEKDKIKLAWSNFENDCISRMFSKVDENKLGWNNSVYESINKMRLAEKVAKILSGKYSYKDCVDAANYLMILGMFQKDREVENY